MAHRRRYRRRYRRHARKNPLSDNAKIALAVGATAVVVGFGIFLWKRQPTDDKQNGNGDKKLPGGTGDKKLPGDANTAAALLAAQQKFASLIGTGDENAVYAFQMAIGAVQALGIPPENVIGIATAAVAAHLAGTGVSLAKAQETATFYRDWAGLGPNGAAGAQAINESIRKAKWGSGPSF